MDTKRCSRCWEIKPKSEFYPAGQGRKRVRGECKTCKSIDQKSTSFATWNNRQYHNSEVRDEVLADTIARYESRRETEAALLKEHGLSIHNAEDTDAIIKLLE